MPAPQAQPSQTRPRGAQTNASPIDTTAYTTLLTTSGVICRVSFSAKLAQVFSATASAPTQSTISSDCARSPYEPPNSRSSSPDPPATTAAAGTCTAAMTAAERRSSTAKREGSYEPSANTDSPTENDTAFSRLAIWNAT